jgi:hypothetical protein
MIRGTPGAIETMRLAVVAPPASRTLGSVDYIPVYCLTAIVLKAQLAQHVGRVIVGPQIGSTKSDMPNARSLEDRNSLLELLSLLRGRQQTIVGMNVAVNVKPNSLSTQPSYQVGMPLQDYGGDWESGYAAIPGCHTDVGIHHRHESG